MSTQKSNTLIKKALGSVVRVSDNCWWMRGFAKLSFEAQQGWYQVAHKWFEERPECSDFITGTTVKQKNDIVHIMAASLWGQLRSVEKEEERVQQIIECWEGQIDEHGKYRPY